ncbi:MAG: nickel insertion protein, partial [Candidatus Hydrogenedentota bacterium]
PPLIGAVMDCGARDAFLTPVQGKKGRPGHLVTVLCDESQVEAVTQALFANSTTLGLRTRTESRYCLERSWEWVATPWGEVRVKIGHLNGQPHQRQPEYEDCRQRAEEAGVPVRTVYAAALAAAVREEAPDA